jgi:uncharacterized protein
MKIAVISDTHLPRFTARLAVALERVASEGPDLILHCGDLTTLEATFVFERIAPVDAVAGNNDGPEIVRRYGRRKIVACDGLLVGMIHGDGRHGTTLGRARAAFSNERVDAVVFGHSHVPYLERENGVLLLNPGSPTDKRRQPRFSFAVLETAGGVPAARLVFFD